MTHQSRSNGFRHAACLLAFLAAPAMSQDLTWFDAIRSGDLDTVKMLLAGDADPNQAVPTPGSPLTPLAMAVIGHREDVALLLLGHGAVDMEISDEINVLDAAAEHGLARVLEFALREDRTLFSDPKFNIRHRGLELGASHGHFDVVDLVLRLSVEFDEPVAEDSVLYAFQLALLDGHDDIARHLIPFARAPFPGALAAVAHVGSPGMARELLDLGADPYVRHEMRRGARYPVELALDRYAEARTPFDQEIARRVVHELVDVYTYDAELAYRAAEVALNGRDHLIALAAEEPELAFIEAARYGYYDIVSDTIQAGMPGVVAGSGSLVLADAARVALLADHDDIARLLLRSGAPADSGILHAATRRSSAGMVRYVLSLGADPMKHFEGRVPAEYWLERVEADNDVGAWYVLYELIVGGAEVCWLTEHAATLGINMHVLADRAPDCWPDP